jgi:hypothetical protein
MARLKRILKSALEDRSPRYMLATIALAVVVALSCGFAIGYKVEQSRAKPAKKAAVIKKPTQKHPKRVILKAAPLLVGGIFRPGAKQLVIVNVDKRVVHVGLGPKTRIVLAQAAKGSDIVVGSRVLFQAARSSATTATEVVVLPPDALVGTPVTAVVPGTSMTVKSLKGSTVIKTTGATVVKAGPSNRKHLLKGTHVIVQYYIVGTRHPAVEIVALLQNTKFV